MEIKIIGLKLLLISSFILARCQRVIVGFIAGWNVSKLTSVILILYFSVNVSTGQDAHSRNEKISQPNYHKGIEPFKTMDSYTLVLKANDVSKQSHRKSGAAYISKSSSQKDDLYFQLASIFPAGTVFRIESAFDNDNGNVEITINSKELMTKPKSDDILSFKNKDDGLAFVRPVAIEADSATKTIPNGWDKERGFAEILSQLGSGRETVKVSIVFDNPDNKQVYWKTKPFYSVIEHLKRYQVGDAFGLGFSENKKAWWTQEIDLVQANYLNENTKVVNLIPRP